MSLRNNSTCAACNQILTKKDRLRRIHMVLIHDSPECLDVYSSRFKEQNHQGDNVYIKKTNKV